MLRNLSNFICVSPAKTSFLSPVFEGAHCLIGLCLAPSDDNLTKCLRTHLVENFRLSFLKTNYTVETQSTDLLSICTLDKPSYVCFQQASWTEWNVKWNFDWHNKFSVM
jgi:hypothetical protein